MDIRADGFRGLPGVHVVDRIFVPEHGCAGGHKPRRRTTRTTINQKLNGGKWNGLGIYSLIAGATYTITITSQPGPSSTSADAVKITYTRDAVEYVEYVAFGDSITMGGGSNGDDYTPDDTSLDGRNTGGGYEPILNNLLTSATGIPHSIINEGTVGISL